MFIMYHHVLYYTQQPLEPKLVKKLELHFQNSTYYVISEITDGLRIVMGYLIQVVTMIVINAAVYLCVLWHTCSINCKVGTLHHLQSSVYI